MSEFKLEDLKLGDIVEIRNGERLIYLPEWHDSDWARFCDYSNGVFVNPLEPGYINAIDYNEDLTMQEDEYFSCFPEFDIMKVWRPQSFFSVVDIMWIAQGDHTPEESWELLYEREETYDYEPNQSFLNNALDVYFNKTGVDWRTVFGREKWGDDYMGWEKDDDAELGWKYIVRGLRSREKEI